MRSTLRLTVLACLPVLPLSAQPMPGTMGLEEWSLDFGRLVIREGELQAAPAGGDRQSSYFIAPEELHGDWSGLVALSFEKMCSGGSHVGADWPGTDGDVVLVNGDRRATFVLPEDHDGDWHVYRVPLDGAGWGAGTLQRIPENVTGFRIRAEFGYGPDRSAIRSLTFE